MNLPKVESGLSFEEYLAREGFGSTAFTILNKSPKAFEYFFLKDHKRETTEELNFGKMVHSAILEPEDFNKRFVIQPKFDRRTKEGKSSFEKWASDLPPGAMVLSEDKAADLIGMIESIKNHTRASDLLRRGESEVSVFHEIDGVPVKGRFDFLVSDSDALNQRTGLYIVDLKTTQDAAFRAFNSSVLRYGYWIQAGLYSWLAEKAFNLPVIFIFLAVEKKPPYEVGLYVADESVIECGREAVRRGIKSYKECLKTNTWPGICEDFKNLSMPENMMNNYISTEEDPNV
jgi:hypothetical protein